MEPRNPPSRPFAFFWPNRLAALRIVGGKFKGRSFRAPKNLPTRPTTSFAKEGLFNVLENAIHWPDTTVLDLFAGLGSLGFEAASRGANAITMVERHGRCAQWLKATASALQLEVDVIRSDALKMLNENKIRYDLVVADPPYDFQSYDQLIELVLSLALSPEGQFILEHDKDHNFDNYSSFQMTKRYGEVNFSFFYNS